MILNCMNIDLKVKLPMCMKAHRGVEAKLHAFKPRKYVEMIR
jgi:hypothetical protein